jgi:hypothetical protein
MILLDELFPFLVSFWEVAVFALILLLLLSAANLSYAHANFTGYSGAPGGSGTCAGSCHGSSGGTVTVTGFPAQYSPGQSYLITIQRVSGSSIANFNGSCRIGTGSQNAGTISAGTLTATYNVSGETNGIHLSSNNQTSATFNWAAPASGTGTVRLYVAAHQGTASGANTVIVQVSDESASVPGPATNPSPANSATNVLPDVVLSWTAGNGATSHDVYFGLVNPPPFIGNQTATQYDPAGTLLAGTTYYWQIDERNAVGVTPGELWQFTVMNLPQPASLPSPQDSAVNVPVATTLDWTAGAGATTHEVFFGTLPGNLVLQSTQDTTAWDPTGDLNPAVTYYWRVDERNAAGVTSGTVWSFTTEATAADESRPTVASAYGLGAAYPNPFNAVVTIPFALPRASEVRLSVYDLHGREVAVLVSGELSAGQHSVQWNGINAASGLYFIRLRTPNGVLSSKIALLK